MSSSLLYFYKINKVKTHTMERGRKHDAWTGHILAKYNKDDYSDPYIILVQFLLETLNIFMANGQLNI